MSDGAFCTDCGKARCVCWLDESIYACPSCGKETCYEFPQLKYLRDTQGRWWHTKCVREELGQIESLYPVVLHASWREE